MYSHVLHLLHIPYVGTLHFNSRVVDTFLQSTISNDYL